MRSQRKVETPDQRSHRLLLAAQTRRAEAAADDAAVDRMIRRNIEQFGP